TKPVDAERLVGTLMRLTGGACGAAYPDVGPPLVSTLLHDPRVAKVLPGFLERLDGRLAAMRAAACGSELDELAQIAHALRGTAGNYGFPELSRQAGRIEDEARSGRDKGALADYIEMLGVTMARAQRGYEGVSS